MEGKNIFSDRNSQNKIFTQILFVLFFNTFIRLSSYSLNAIHLFLQAFTPSISLQLTLSPL